MFSLNRFGFELHAQPEDLPVDSLRKDVQQIPVVPHSQLYIFEIS